MLNDKNESIGLFERKRFLHLSISFLCSFWIGLMPLAWCQNYQHWYQLGVADFRRGSISAAIEDFKNSLAENPHHVLSLLGLARALKKSGQSKESIPYYRQTLELDPHNITALMDLAEVLSWKESSRNEAIKLLQNAIKLYPSNFTAKRQLGIVSSWNPQLRTEAIGQLKQVAAHNPSDYEVIAILGKLLDESGSSTNRPKLVGIKKAEADLQKGYLRLAISEFEEIIKKEPHDLRALLGLGQALKQSGEGKKCISYFKRVLEIEPNNLTALSSLSEVLIWHKSTLKESLPYLHTIVHLQPANISARRKLGLMASWYPENRIEAIAQLESVLKVQPNDYEVVLTLARLLDWSHQWQKAEPYFWQYLSHCPSDNKVRLEFAQMLSYEDSRRNQALELFKQLLVEDPNNISAKVGYAQLLVWLKEYDKALTALNQILAIAPSNLSLQLEYATALSGAGRLPEALIQYDKLSQLLPDNSAVALGKAKVLCEQGQLSQAADIYEKLLSLSKLSPSMIESTKLDLANVYLKEKQYEKAKTLVCSVMAQQPQNFDAVRLLAGIELASGNTPGASSILYNLPSQIRERPAFRRMFGELSVQKGDWANAVNQFQSLEKDYPNDPDLTIELGESLIKLGQIKEANSVFDLALSHNPDCLGLVVGKSKTLFLEGNKEESINLVTQRYETLKWKAQDIMESINAMSGDTRLRPLSIAMLQEVLQQTPANEEARLILAQILSWSPATRKESIRNFNLYLKKKPDDFKAQLWLADVLSWTKNYKESLKIYSQLLDKNPNDLKLLTGYAQVLSWNGNLSKAMRLYKKVLSVEPDNCAAWIGLGQCQNWDGDHFKAEQTLIHADQICKNNSAVKLERAINYKDMGRFDKSADLLSKVERTSEQKVSY